MNEYPRKPNHPQSGFSLVEILVAMALGLVLLGGTIVIYASSKNSYRLQENIAGMQENARFAILALRSNLEMAGFPSINDVEPFLVGSNETSDGSGSNSDQITIRYESRAPLTTDCLGTDIPQGNIIESHYFINADNNLACRGNGNRSPQTLVENIDNMQILYGVDTDAGGDGVANLYISASEVEAGVVSVGTPDWDKVVSLRLALLVSSETAINNPATATGADSPTAPSTSVSTSRDFTLLDAPTITKDDGRLYRVFTTTIPLRNRIP